MLKPTFASLSPAATVLLSSLLAAAGCVSRAPIAEAPCPCPAGSVYVCCDGRCVIPAAGTCPGPAGTGGSSGAAGFESHDAAASGGASGAALDAAASGGASGAALDAAASGGASGATVGVVTNPFVSVGIGAAHACAVRQDGTIKCAGANDKGQATPPPGLYYQVVAGAYHTCGQIMYLADRHVDHSWVCWGDNTYGQSNAPPGPMGYVSAGERHTCWAGSPLPGGPQIVCLGDNSLGQLAAPPGTGSATALAAGRNHTCAIVAEDPDAGLPTGSGNLVCWGDNSSGQATPPLATTSINAALAAGGDHTCVANNFVTGIECWGANDLGQSTEPAGVTYDLSLASGHSCFSPNGKAAIFCWGTGWGTALPMPPTGDFSLVFAGDYLNCALPWDRGAPMVCWGQTYEPWY